MQKYELLSVIGEGAYGVVLKCRDLENDTNVAIKKFKDSDDEELTRKTAMREVKVLKMLSHENIVEMREAFRKKGIVYLVFEYVENNLLEVLERAPNGLPPTMIRKLMYQLVKGLAYLHSLDIVHRDIKPENLLVGFRHELKICDFGFARPMKREKTDQELTDYVATRWYRPPQLLVGGEYGKEIDMWAVGCIMCELVDGNPLFPGENELEQLFLIQKTFGPLPEQLNERFVKNQRFVGLKFPQIQNFDPIDKKYFGKIDNKGLAFVKALLKMVPNERLTAEQALNHPYFEPQKNRNRRQPLSAASRKEMCTAATFRKKEGQQLEECNNINKITNYGKIYNKRKNNYNAIAMVYQSSGTCKMHSQLQCKSMGKSYLKKMTTFNQKVSVDQLSQKEMLHKTQSKSFCIEDNEKKGNSYVESTRKTHGSWLSTNQLPFLMITQQQPEQKPTNLSKMKPHVNIQKTTSHSTTSNTRSNIAPNLSRK